MEKIVAEISGRAIEKDNLLKFKNMIADVDQLKVFFLLIASPLLNLFNSKTDCSLLVSVS